MDGKLWWGAREGKVVLVVASHKFLSFWRVFSCLFSRFGADN